MNWFRGGWRPVGYMLFGTALDQIAILMVPDLPPSWTFVAIAGVVGFAMAVFGSKETDG